MDLREIARAHRRRQAIEALEFERSREAALQEQLEETVTELEGPSIDEEAFVQMEAEDVEIVRRTLVEPDTPFAEEGIESWLADEEGELSEVPREERLAEVARLEEEIAKSRRCQRAFERYLDAVGGTPEPSTSSSDINRT